MEINKCYYCMEDINEGSKVCPHCGKRSDELNQSEFALQPGTILHGKYLIGAVLGQGGFGITYVAYDLSLGIKVAVKEYYPSYMVSRSRSGGVLWSSKAPPKEEGCSSFLKEARKMARLMNIPEVVRVLEILQENDTAYIVMDFVEGITLKEKLKRDGIMSEAEAAALLGPIAEALDKVHKQGIIHRDISPDNIMIDREGCAKLLDLGAAKEMDMRSSEDRQSSQMIHKDGFSPPEQYTTGSSIGAWTDVYAMSATFLYCVTGRLVPQAMNRMLSGEAVEYTERISPPVREVLEKGLAVRPDERFQTMGEFWSDLTNSLNTTVKQSIKNAEVQKKADSGAEQKVNETKKPEPRPNRLKKMIACAAVAAAVLIAAAFSIHEAGNNSFEETATASGTEAGDTIKESAYEQDNSKTSVITEISSADVGDTVIFGAYEQDNDGYNGREDIEWRVLAKEDGRILVISEKALDCQPYNAEYEAVTWETCTLRAWLNGTFLNNAFTTAEQEQIQSTNVSADKNPKYSTNPGNGTTDKVFLLSITEAEKYLTSNKDRKCVPTEYAIEQGAWTSDGAGNCWWWLRSPGYYQTFTAGVDSDGSVLYGGHGLSHGSGCVRPVLWITLPEHDSEPQNSYNEKNGTELSSAAVGDTVIFGAYEQDNDGYNGREDIEWRVLAKEGNRILVISEKALDCQPYNSEWEELTWETCTLREWLNGTFLNNAFTSAEQAQIQSTKATAYKNPEYDTNPGNATTDKVFLLSITEAEKYFTSDEDRMCVSTEYAIAQDAYSSSSYIKDGKATCWWWLRSPGCMQNYAASVGFGGSANYRGNLVNGGHGCVRPALWINLGS